MGYGSQNRQRLPAVVRNSVPQSENKLVRSLLLPADTPPVRFTTTPPCQTSIFSFEQVGSLNVAVAQAWGFLVFQDPVYPLWRSIDQSITACCYRNVSFPADSDNTRRQTLPTSAGVTLPLSLTADLFGTSASSGMASLTNNGMTSDLPLGMVEESADTWWFVPQGAVPALRFSGSAVLTGGVYSVTVTYSPDGTTANSRPITMVSSIYLTTYIDAYGKNGTTTPGGWYKLTSIECVIGVTTPLTSVLSQVIVGWVTTNDTTAGTFNTPTAAVVDGFYPMRAYGQAEMTVAPSIYEQCRLNAASFLFQNVTTVLTKEGAVKAGVLRAAGTSVFRDNATALAKWDDTHPSRRYTGYLEKGLYLYMAPQMSSNRLLDSVNIKGGNLPIFRMSDIDYYYYFTLNPGTNTQSFQVTYACHHETQNDSMLYPTGVSSLPLEEVRQAKIVANAQLPFIENPLHLAAFGAMARSLAARAWHRIRPNINPLAHTAVDYLIPKYKTLAITGGQNGERDRNRERY